MARVTVELDADQVGWLHTLVGAYRELREAVDQMDEEVDGLPIDEDPTATLEMLFAAEKLYATLFAALWAAVPPPPPIWPDDTTVPY